MAWVDELVYAAEVEAEDVEELSEPRAAVAPVVESLLCAQVAKDLHVVGADRELERVGEALRVRAGPARREGGSGNEAPRLLQDCANHSTRLLRCRCSHVQVLSVERCYLSLLCPQLPLRNRPKVTRWNKR